jgi:hypothetical protein
MPHACPTHAPRVPPRIGGGGARERARYARRPPWPPRRGGRRAPAAARAALGSPMPRSHASGPRGRARCWPGTGVEPSDRAVGPTRAVQGAGAAAAALGARRRALGAKDRGNHQTGGAGAGRGTGGAGGPPLFGTALVGSRVNPRRRGLPRAGEAVLARAVMVNGKHSTGVAGCTRPRPLGAAHGGPGTRQLRPPRRHRTLARPGPPAPSWPARAHARSRGGLHALARSGPARGGTPTCRHRETAMPVATPTWHRQSSRLHNSLLFIKFAAMPHRREREPQLAVYCS